MAKAGCYHAGSNGQGHAKRFNGGRTRQGRIMVKYMGDNLGCPDMVEGAKWPGDLDVTILSPYWL